MNHEVSGCLYDSGLAATRRMLEHRFALVLKAATFDDLVGLLAALADQLVGLGLVDTDRQDIMGGLDLPGLPAWGAGGDLAQHGAWSWDATRVLYLDEGFHPRVERRTDIVDDASDDDAIRAAKFVVGVPANYEVSGCLYKSGRLAAATCIMAFYTAEGASDASEALEAMMASDSWQGYGERGSASGREIRAELERERWHMPENIDLQDVSLAWGDVVEALESRILDGEDGIGLASEVIARRARRAGEAS